MELLDKIPPQNLEAEQAVLGSTMLEKEAVYAVLEIIQPQDFYKDSNQLIFEAVQRLAERNEPVDLITITDELRTLGNLEKAGGVTYLATVANSVPSAANVEYYARIVAEKSLLRKLIKASSKISALCFEEQEDPVSLLDQAERLILSISGGSGKGNIASIRSVLLETLNKIESLYLQNTSVTGVASHYHALDRFTSGWQKSDLIILAARPAMGKTSLCLNIAQNVAVKDNLPVAVFSLEMSKEQLVQRMLCAEAMVDAQKLRNGRLTEEDWVRLTNAVAPLSNAPVYIDDTPGITVMELRSKTRKLKAEKGLGLVVIDYLQLMQGNKRTDNRQQEISEISRSLKALARELDVPIIALSQLSRAVEQGNEKRPSLSHLRESGALEQDADLVMFIYRDEYYNPESEKKNIAEVIIAKHRHGPVGSVELGFIKEYTKFVNLDKVHTA